MITKPDGSDYDIYRDGLKIYTTIDSRMQLRRQFCPYGKPSRRVFIQLKNNKKCAFINISTDETDRI
jgi:penicillin-binding protein 1A